MSSPSSVPALDALDMVRERAEHRAGRRSLFARIDKSLKGLASTGVTPAQAGARQGDGTDDSIEQLLKDADEAMQAVTDARQHTGQLERALEDALAQRARLQRNLVLGGILAVVLLIIWVAMT